MSETIINALQSLAIGCGIMAVGYLSGGLGSVIEKIEQWEIDRLIPYARNPRKNDHAVDKIASAIREFGFRVPIVARSNGDVVDGHLRLKAAQKLGMDTVPVVIYIYFLNPEAKKRLTVPVLPFSKIDEMGAGMYKGRPKRDKQAMATTSGTAEGQHLPSRSIFSGDIC